MGAPTFRLNKVKFSLVLPSAQLALALAMLEWARRVVAPQRWDTFYWPTPALVCYGINGPAIFFKLLVFPFTRGQPFWPLVSVFSYGLEDLSFFVGVVVLWFFVGRALDRMMSVEELPERRLIGLGGLPYVFVEFLGMALFLLGIQGLRTPGRWNNYSGNLTESILFLAWSIILILVASRRLKQRLRRA
jgi:hypothetical protein